jgi:hypothetical protein
MKLLIMQFSPLSGQKNNLSNNQITTTSFNILSDSFSDHPTIRRCVV